MSPTLLGRHRVVNCPHCEIQYREPEKWAQPPGKTFPCWHCGGPCQAQGGQVSPGDVVQLIPVLGDALPDRGDLLAIEYRGVWRVKRLVGLPGDTIDLVGDLLLVNGMEVQDGWEDEVRILVDSDTLRDDSRWQPMSKGWHRKERHWLAEPTHRTADLQKAMPLKTESDDRSSWLVYGHQNVHSGNRPSPIQDDYPGNTSLVRPLVSVQSLSLSLNAGCQEGIQGVPGASELNPMAAVLDVLFWTPNGSRHSSVVLDDQMRLHRFDSKQSAPGGPTGIVSPTHPVAIRASGRCVISGVMLERSILYRLNPKHAGDSFPMRLAEGECFVLGDNVPLSVDSRDWGPIPISCIRARVEGDPERAVESTEIGPGSSGKL